jgi:polyphosphate kinase 2 (PPK2 family)
MERLDDADKNWKFSESDVQERKFWDDYQDAYEKMIRNTATEYAPWIVVPADNKWFSRLLVVATIVDALHSMDLKFPKLTDAQYAALKVARKQLEKE